nr:MAG TPA: Replication initiation and membrane attachment [Caudoviricetes sp.]
MGNRRMISKTVTQTHRFLRLPLETQALYFHLIQNCDDDGVVEAFPILRMIGANKDNLGLLVIKQFVKPLNDEMVYFVVDFHEQNTVRKDRYVPSVYKELLEENTDETTGKPLVNQTATTGCPNISKDNISKSNLSKSNSREDETSENGQNSSSAANNSEINIFDYYQNRIGLLDGYQLQKLEEYRTFDGLEPELIKIAIDKAADNSKRSFGYVNSILKSWAQNGIKTVAQQREEQDKFESKKPNSDMPKFGPRGSKY